MASPVIASPVEYEGEREATRKGKGKGPGIAKSTETTGKGKGKGGDGTEKGARSLERQIAWTGGKGIDGSEKGEEKGKAKGEEKGKGKGKGEEKGKGKGEEKGKGKGKASKGALIEQLNEEGDGEEGVAAEPMEVAWSELQVVKLEDVLMAQYRVPGGVSAWKIKVQLWGTGGRKKSEGSRKVPEGVWRSYLVVSDLRTGKPTNIVRA
jgi:hypothetical protein